MWIGDVAQFAECLPTHTRLWACSSDLGKGVGVTNSYSCDSVSGFSALVSSVSFLPCSTPFCTFCASTCVALNVTPHGLLTRPIDVHLMQQKMPLDQSFSGFCSLSCGARDPG